MEHRDFHPLAPPEHGGRHAHGPRDASRCGAGRVIAYFITLIVLNVLLAVYALYMLGFALAFDWSILKSGTLQVILESALQLLLFFSPVILTILLNRLLYRAFRGRRRFPRGTWFFALLAIVVIQAATVFTIFSYGYVDGVNGLSIESISAQPLD
ncbi:MAG: hypothetical protein GX417_02535 [Clostridiales bacterium]|nr:hypothetical protein [Clostridiales bacterium]